MRKLPLFSTFLDVAALSDTEPVSFASMGRDCGISPVTARNYFEILKDTLLGNWLPAFRGRPKRRIVQASKFYFADVGVVNVLAKRRQLEAGNALFGKAFENWVHHELRSYVQYRAPGAELSYWRLPSGIEVDFVIDDGAVAIEAKASTKTTPRHLKGLREFKKEFPQARRLVLASLESQPYRTEDGIEVLPASTFARKLWD